MSEWKEYKLGEISRRIVSGGTPKSSIFAYYDGNIPWLNTKEVDFNRIANTERCITELGLENSSAKWIPRGSVIVAMYGATAGKVAYSKIDLTTNQACCNLIIDKEKADSEYVYYYLMSSYDRLSNLACGAAQQNLSVGVISNFSILLPPLDEQKRIAGVLSSLDDKIDLLNRENATLEALAETLFRHYFIENPDPTWKEGNIADVVDFNPARKLGKGEKSPYVEMANIGTNGYAPSSWRIRTFMSGTKFINGDALMARISPCLENGKAAFVDFLEKEQVGWGSTEFIVMRSKLGIHPFFTYVLSRYDDFRDHAVSSLVGSSGRQRVDLYNLIKYPFIIPDKQAIELFNHELNAIFPKMQNNQKQILTLTAQRDTLLSRLMNGEVKVDGH